MEGKVIQTFLNLIPKLNVNYARLRAQLSGIRNNYKSSLKNPDLSAASLCGLFVAFLVASTA